MSDSIPQGMSFTPWVKMVGLLISLIKSHSQHALESAYQQCELMVHFYASVDREMVVSEVGLGKVSKTKEKD